MTEVVASFSGGKDSTAMVLRMIERGDQLDEVIFCDTGMEFPAMYDHIAKVREAVEASGVAFTTLKHPDGFEWLLCDRPISSKGFGEHSGYGWPYARARWCTRHLKSDLIDRHLRGRDAIQCTGLAADEAKRIERQTNAAHRHPLAEWGWTEDVCLGYCYGRGFDWYDPSVGKGLYEIFDRTSCWICPLSSLDNLRKLRRYYPGLWAEIGRMEGRVRRERESRGYSNPSSWAYTPRYTWAELEERFMAEDERDEVQTLIERWGP